MQDTDLATTFEDSEALTGGSTATSAPRARSRRGELSRARVLAAALELLERDGESALSMRRLAAELGSAPMSLYRHVANKEDLVDGVIALALSDLTTERPEGDDLATRMTAWMHGLRSQLKLHPTIIPLMRSDHLIMPSFLGTVEVMMREFRDAGVPRAQAALSAFEMLSFTMNYAVNEQIMSGVEEPMGVVIFSSATKHTDELPLIADAIKDFAALDVDAIFDASSRHLVAGMCADLKAHVPA